MVNKVVSGFTGGISTPALELEHDLTGHFDDLGSYN